MMNYKTFQVENQGHYDRWVVLVNDKEFDSGDSVGTMGFGIISYLIAHTGR